MSQYKNFVLAVAVMAMSILTAQNALAGSCNGRVMGQDVNNGKGIVWTDCKSMGNDFRVQGLAYNDMRSTGSGDNRDTMDAASAVCRSISKGNYMLPMDFQAQPLVMQCEKQEVFAGISCNDMKGEDSSDGCCIACQKPGSNSLRWISNNGDTGCNGETLTTLLPERVIAIGQSDKNGGSDESDGVAICVGK